MLRFPPLRVMEGFTHAAKCGCYVDAEEVREGAQQDFPKACLESCRSQFLQAVSPDWKGDSGWLDGCRNLTSRSATSRFWSLYWCDSTFCGVAIDQAGGLEQDREYQGS